MAEYRIVEDRWAGFEVQIRTRWWPFWRQPRTNTHSTMEAAERWALAYATGPKVKYLGKLP